MNSAVGQSGLIVKTAIMAHYFNEHMQPPRLPGMTFRHGTFYSYITKKCRCEVCKPFWSNYQNGTALKEWRELVKPSTGLWEDSFLASLANRMRKESAIPVNQRVQERTSCERTTDNSPGKAEPKSNDCTTCGGAKVVPSGDRRGQRPAPHVAEPERNNSKPEEAK